MILGLTALFTVSPSPPTLSELEEQPATLQGARTEEARAFTCKPARVCTKLELKSRLNLC